MKKTLVLSPLLTFDTVNNDFKRLELMLASDKASSIRLDLQKVTHCDSAGLALLLEGKRLAHKYQKSLEIHGISESVLALAEFSGIKDVLR